MLSMVEDVVSTRAVVAEYRRRGGLAVSDGRAVTVAEIAQRAGAGELLAKQALDDAYRLLGEALAPYINAFQAEAVVIGGGISAALPLIEPPLRTGLDTQTLPIVPSIDTEASAPRGAAMHALRGEG